MGAAVCSEAQRGARGALIRPSSTPAKRWIAIPPAFSAYRHLAQSGKRQYFARTVPAMQASEIGQLTDCAIVRRPVPTRDAIEPASRNTFGRLQAFGTAKMTQPARLANSMIREKAALSSSWTACLSIAVCVMGIRVFTSSIWACSARRQSMMRPSRCCAECDASAESGVIPSNPATLPAIVSAATDKGRRVMSRMCTSASSGGICFGGT